MTGAAAQFAAAANRVVEEAAGGVVFDDAQDAADQLHTTTIWRWHTGMEAARMTVPRPGEPLHVLRLCSVFEPPDGTLSAREARFDPIGGMQNHTANLSRALDRRGVVQTVITSRLGGGTSCTPFGRYARVHRVGAPIRSLRQLWALHGVRLAWRQHPVHLVHAHQGEDLATLPLAAAAARRHGCPLVVTLHTSVGYTVPSCGAKLTALRLVGGPTERRLLARADRIIALTDATAGRLGILEAKASVIPSGVEPHRFDASADSILRDVPGPRILYLGRLARQKDVPTLVAAFGLMRGPASLVIVGDGPHRPAVDAAVAVLPDAVRRRVHRFGFQSHKDVPGILAGADVLVLPSVYEEMGSVLVEALQAGVPVVASRVGGIPHVVRDGETGLLVTPASAAEFAQAIDWLLDDPARRDQMRRRSIQQSGNYNWDGLVDRVLDVYGDALDAHRWGAVSRPATGSIG